MHCMRYRESSKERVSEWEENSPTSLLCDLPILLLRSARICQRDQTWVSSSSEKPRCSLSQFQLRPFKRSSWVKIELIRSPHSLLKIREKLISVHSSSMIILFTIYCKVCYIILSFISLQCCSILTLELPRIKKSWNEINITST